MPFQPEAFNLTTSLLCTQSLCQHHGTLLRHLAIGRGGRYLRQIGTGYPDGDGAPGAIRNPQFIGSGGRSANLIELPRMVTPVVVEALMPQGMAL